MFLTLKKLSTYLTGNTMSLYYKDDLVSFASGQNGWCFRSSGTWRRVERIRTFQECIWGRFLGRLFLESLALKMRILWNVRSSSANITCRKTWMVRRPQIWHPFVTVFWSSPYQHLTHSQLTAHWPHRWALHCAPLLLSTGTGCTQLKSSALNKPPNWGLSEVLLRTYGGIPTNITSSSLQIFLYPIHHSIIIRPLHAAYRS